MTWVFGRGYPPPRNRLASHGRPIPVHLQRFLVDAGFLHLQLAVLRNDPEIDQVFSLWILRVMKFHVRKETVTVDRSGEVDIVITQFQVLTVERIIKG